MNDYAAGLMLNMDPTFNLFKSKAELANAEIYHFSSKAEALDFVCGFVASEASGGGYALWAECSFLSGVDKKELERKAPHIRFDVNRQSASEAAIGISQVDWGVANTGTLVQDASAIEQRLVSMLPLIHVALLATRRIVDDLPALLPKLTPKQSNYISFITGPSRTADIERVLTIGVHGPKRLVIVAVDDLA